MVRKGFKQLGFFALHALVTAILAGITSFIEMLFSESGGRDASGFLPTTLYRPCIPLFILGIVVFCVGYFFIWTKWISKDFAIFNSLSKLWYIGVAIITVIFGIVIFLVNILIMFAVTGLFSSYGNFTDYFILFYHFVVIILLPIIVTLVKKVKAKK